MICSDRSTKIPTATSIDIAIARSILINHSTFIMLMYIRLLSYKGICLQPIQPSCCIHCLPNVHGYCPSGTRLPSFATTAPLCLKLVELVMRLLQPSCASNSSKFKSVQRNELVLQYTRLIQLASLFKEVPHRNVRFFFYLTSQL